MTKRRTPQDGNYTPKVIDLYKRTRKLYDDASTREALDKTDFGELEYELNGLLARAEPWKTSIFDTVNEDEPPDWLLKLGGDQLQRWHDAKKVLTELEAAAKRR